MQRFGTLTENEIVVLLTTAWDGDAGPYVRLYARRAADVALRCQSPIEVKLVAELMLINAAGRFVVEPGDKFLSDDGKLNRIEIEAQVVIDKYTADFVLTVFHQGKPGLRMVVECDGHDYHERTKEQAAHDKARDRFMTSQGYVVFRFTGSEIHRDARKCADEIRDFILKGLMAKQVANG